MHGTLRAMTLVDDETRRLATVERILDIRPIPNADAIEAARVRGWTVVVRKGEFAPGDPVIYFEIDAALPLDDARFAFLAPRGSREIDGRQFHVLRTAKLRGTYSQGLALPAVDFPDVDELDLRKWEAPIPGGNEVGPFLTAYADKTDSERAQNLVAEWSNILDREWVATEKVDGTSCSIVCDQDGAIHVCGRNWEIAEGDNLYWRAARSLPLNDFAAGDVVQAEIVGPGIQGNRLGLPTVRLVVFSVVRDREHLPRSEWPGWALALAAPVYDLALPVTAAEAVALVDGIKSLVSPARLAEGVVWHTADGSIVPVLRRSTFKTISNKYLTRE